MTEPASTAAAEPQASTQPKRFRRFILPAIAGFVGLAALFYLIGAFVVHEIDDDLTFVPSGVEEGGSRAIAMTASLIEREIDTHRWTANDPFFLPGAMLDNMPNYQQGIVYALSRFTAELSDQIGRARGSSQIDPDLDRAAGLLRYPGTIWIFDLSTSLAPTTPAETNYRAAAERLRAYDRRLIAGEAVFERRTDNLIQTLERIAADLGSASALIARHLDGQAGWPIDFEADDIFYATKGRLYAYAMLLRELGQDFEGVLTQRAVGAVWSQMMLSIDDAASLQPTVVVSGAPSSQILPSHLAAQGFYLLRARTQIREVTNILAN